MAVKKGHSGALGARAAVAEFAERVWQPDMALVLFFASPVFARDVLADALLCAFPGVTVLGCTTAGEITPEGYREETITGVSFGSDAFAATLTLIPNLDTFKIEDGAAIVAGALERHRGRGQDAAGPPPSTFGMLLIDGLSRQEETVIVSLCRALDTMSLFGGSAGDGLDFGSTWVYCDGAFHTNAAVLALIATSCPFKVFRFDHFMPTERKMVVTEADPSRRLVTEINAEPAALEYARLVGLPERQLSPMIFAAHPVVVRVGGEYHVRSIQKVEDDGSLRFYCAIDEGLVLTVASSHEIAGHLDRALTKVRDEIGNPQIILGFDCILRRLEVEQKQKTREVSAILSKHGVIGFSTYGEQFRSMHVNQTFTGVAIGGPVGVLP
jgi:hypothetical protein